MPDPIRIAVIGAGAFGRNHLRVLHELQTPVYSARLPPRPDSPFRSGEASTISSSRGQTANLPPVQLIAAVDSNPDARDFIAATYNIPTFSTVDQMLAASLDLHAATIAVPTVAHARIATQLLEANLDLLIEKPITSTLAEADALMALAADRHRILAAGHLERFNPAVTAALERLTRPMFFEAHRLSIFTPRSLDVDVVLDLMIHDLDILLTMTNSPVTEVRAVGLPVLSRQVDIANVRLEFSTGAIANLTASRVSTEQIRKLRLFQPAQYLSLDYARQELLTIHVDTATQPSANALPRPAFTGGGEEGPETHSTSAGPATQPVTQPHPSTGLAFEKSTLPRTEPLRLELEDFLHAIATRSGPRVSAQAARNALALALDITAAIRNHTASLNL